FETSHDANGDTHGAAQRELRPPISRGSAASPSQSRALIRQMVITLIGYRGTGKSTVARALGARLGWAAVDADDDIEARAGKSIERIFAEDGEAGFRRLERETMHRLLSEGNQRVIAAGGGAVLDEQTRGE